MRNLIAIAALLALILAPGIADGQTIYQCVIKGKPTSYQNQPCSANARLASAREYHPEAAPSQEQIRARQASVPPVRQASPGSGTGRRGHGPRAHLLPIGGSGCAEAKRARDAWERRVGLDRDYRSLQIWNDRVQRACR